MAKAMVKRMTNNDVDLLCRHAFAKVGNGNYEEAFRVRGRLQPVERVQVTHVRSAKFLFKDVVDRFRVGQAFTTVIIFKSSKFIYLM